MADEFENEEAAAQRDFVTLVDRVSAEHGTKREIQCGGRVRVFKPGQVEMIVPRDLALWLHRHNRQAYVWTMEDEYLCRYGIKDADEQLMHLLGADSIVTTPVERDYNRAEGWDTSAIDHERGPVRHLTEREAPWLRRRHGDYPNQAHVGSRADTGRGA